MRFGSQVIDWIILGIIYFIIGYAFFGSVSWQVAGTAALPVIMTNAIIVILYYVVLEGINGATLGKKLLKIKVVKEDGSPCGLGAAFIITVRFGLTLQTPRRALRYAMFVVVAVVLISPLSFVARHDAILSKVVPKLLVRQNRYLQDPPDVSPDGRYAIVCQIRWKRANADITKRYWMVRLSDGKRERITMPEWRSTYWTPSDAVYYLEHGLGRENRSSVLWIVRMDDCGRITQKHVRVGYGVGFFLWPSPDRRFAIVSSHMRESDNRMATTLEFVDVENARRLPIIIRGVSKHFAADWWQTNRKVGYLDAKGNRRFIILPD